MERSISREQYLKRKKKMKRRRLFWTFIFIIIAAVLAYVVVSFAKEKLFDNVEKEPETIVVSSGAETQNEVATDQNKAATSTNPADAQTNSTDVTSNTAGDSASSTASVSEKTAFVVKQADAWQYILVNKSNAVADNFAPPETYLLQKQYKSDARIKTATLDMFNAAEADGVRLIACSAYRPYDYQQKLFDRMKAKFSNLSDEEAAIEAAKIVAKPGTSEHQTGLALDIVTPTYTSLDEGYGNTKAAKWLAANAHQYGFILRYPKDKTEITQIIFEPWHYRYVGKEAAKIIFEEGICYEEFYERIQFEKQ